MLILFHEILRGIEPLNVKKMLAKVWTHCILVKTNFFRGVEKFLKYLSFDGNDNSSSKLSIQFYIIEKKRTNLLRKVKFEPIHLCLDKVFEADVSGHS